MNKAGASQSMWVVIVGALTVLGLVLIFPLFGKTKTLSEQLTDYHICKEGNRGIVQTRFRLFDWVIAEQGVKHCRTERVKVPIGKEYETIANEMALCWDQYLEGKEELFETKDNNYCAFCSVLEFDDNDKKLNGLSKYLVDNIEKSSGKSYMEYLSEIDVKGEDEVKVENLELQNNVFIDTSKKLTIIFTMYKDAYPGMVGQPRTGLTFIGATAGSVAGVGLGLYYLGSAALCLSIIGCAASISLIAIGTGAGASTGYLIGSDRSADWRAKILITEYDNKKLEQLTCTRLEGLDYLRVQKK